MILIFGSCSLCKKYPELAVAKISALDEKAFFSNFNDC